jgi:ABC-2 type transport system permease protein
MAKTLLILKNEIFSLVSRPSFWFGVLGVPAIAFLIYAGIAYLNRSQGETGEPGPGIGALFSPPEDDRPQGYVDLSGLIVDTPEGFPAESMVGYASQSAARADLEAGRISAYYVIAPDYLDTGQVRVFSQEYNLIASEERARDLYWLIDYNLAGSSQQLYQLVNEPLGTLERENLSPPEVQAQERDRDSGLTFFLPYAVMMLFYVSIMGSSGLMLNSVSKEKENRILEVLMVSTGARELLLGKIVGLGLVGLFQVLVWAVSAFGLLQLSGQTFELPDAFRLDPSIILWGVIFFVFGYLVYAALMAGVGALVPSLREASQATTVVVIPMMIPLFIISALIEKPNSPLAVGFSLFPLTSPTTMMLRLAATDVPVWQLLAAVALLAITALLVIRAVAGFFRAQTLLSGQPFKMKRFFLALAGKY